MSELAATTTATAGLPCHHALKCRTSIATPLATVEAVAVAVNSASSKPETLHYKHNSFLFLGKAKHLLFSQVCFGIKNVWMNVEYLVLNKYEHGITSPTIPFSKINVSSYCNKHSLELEVHQLPPLCQNY